MTVNAVRNALQECLTKFQTTFNDNARVKKLIKGWDRAVVVDATDTGNIHSMMIADLSMADVRDGAVLDVPHPIHLQASEATLIDIFSGKYNPAHALIDGALAVFSDEKDKVKLEAITMVIWGL
jgi:hypothetical protein